MPSGRCQPENRWQNRTIVCCRWRRSFERCTELGQWDRTQSRPLFCRGWKTDVDRLHPWNWLGVDQILCVYVCLQVCMCVCVCVRVREREREWERNGYYKAHYVRISSSDYLLCVHILWIHVMLILVTGHMHVHWLVIGIHSNIQTRSPCYHVPTSCFSHHLNVSTTLHNRIESRYYQGVLSNVPTCTSNKIITSNV